MNVMFNFRKNILFGAIAIVALGIAQAFWGPTRTFLLVWVPILERLPFVSTLVRMPDPAGNILQLVLGGLCWTVFAYLIGLGFGIIRLIGLYIAGNPERARRVMRIAKRLKLVWLWRLTFGLAIIADTLDNLPRVRMEEYKGKRGFGFITKVQRVHDRRTKKSWIEFIIYAGDFPMYFLGRWNWYVASLCQRVLNPLGDMAATFATVGLAAPNDLGVEEFSEEDLQEIKRRLKENEGLLLAAGFADPDHPIIDDEAL